VNPDETPSKPPSSPFVMKLAAEPGVRNPGGLAKYIKKKFAKGATSTPKVSK
jgi:hypothetical protein